MADPDAREPIEGKLAFAVKRGKLLMTHIDTVHAELREVQGEAAE